METTIYTVSKKANEKFLAFSSFVKEQSGLFKKQNFCDNLLKFFTSRFGNKIKLKMGSRLLYKSFNRSYFFENLYKNIIALEYLSTIYDLSGSSISNTLTDIGCGSAPSSIAYELLYNNKDTINFRLKDNSKYQMQIAKKMLEYRNISDVNINVSTLSANDFHDIKGLTFFSYFLCEQSDKKILSVIEKIKSINGHFIFIDYENKIEKVENYLTDTPNTHRFKLSVKLDETISEILKTETIKVNGLYLFK